jgi:hypothetical protein
MAYSFPIHAQRETGHRLHDAATDSFEAFERMGGLRVANGFAI